MAVGAKQIFWSGQLISGIKRIIFIRNLGPKFLHHGLIGQVIKAGLSLPSNSQKSGCNIWDSIPF